MKKDLIFFIRHIDANIMSRILFKNYLKYNKIISQVIFDKEQVNDRNK